MKPEIDIPKLITLVSERPVVWDKTSEVYQSRTNRVEAWLQIGSQLSCHFDGMTQTEKDTFLQFVAKRWKHIKDHWRRRKEREKCGVKMSKKYLYHKELSFLSKTFNRSDSTSDKDHSFNHNKIMSKYTNLSKAPGAIMNKLPIPQANLYVQPSQHCRKKKVDIQTAIMTALSVEDDIHLSFFKSLLPTLRQLNVDEILQFQAGVISTIQSIRSKRSPGHEGPAYRR